MRWRATPEPKLEHIEERLAVGFERIPALERAGIKNIVNGPFTFGPHGNPMIGPVPGLRNCRVAVGVMAGFCQAGGVPAILARISFSGELGYEIHVAPEYRLKLAEAIEEAGADLDLRWYGARALMSLRLEKGWGAGTLDYRPGFTAAESSLDAFIHWDKEFVGKQAALAESKAGPQKKLVTMVVETDDTDVCNDEAIMNDGQAVGYVSSGGYAHHVGKSVALGYLPTALAAAGTQVEVEIMGQLYPAEILEKPLYDADGGRMRS
jgi:dimethylglycine dehydrogenase